MHVLTLAVVLLAVPCSRVLGTHATAVASATYSRKLSQTQRPVPSGCFDANCSDWPYMSAAYDGEPYRCNRCRTVDRDFMVGSLCRDAREFEMCCTTKGTSKLTCFTQDQSKGGWACTETAEWKAELRYYNTIPYGSTVKQAVNAHCCFDCVSIASGKSIAELNGVSKAIAELNGVSKGR